MEADKPSGPIATVPDSPASSNPNKLPASSSYLATTGGSTTAPPPLNPLQLQALHNAHSAVMDLDTTTADDRSRRATSVISMDDLEAAQALEGLRSGMSTPVSLRCLQLGKKTKAVELRYCDRHRYRLQNNLGARQDLSANRSSFQILVNPHEYRDRHCQQPRQTHHNQSRSYLYSRLPTRSSPPPSTAPFPLILPPNHTRRVSSPEPSSSSATLVRQSQTQSEPSVVRRALRVVYAGRCKDENLGPRRSPPANVAR